MKIIIVGCGRVGAALAYQLYQQKNQVTIIDSRASALEKLPADFVGRAVVGDPLTHETLHRAEIEQADALAAVSDSDSLNTVVAHIAQALYHVPHVVVRNYDPNWQPVIAAFNLPMAGSANLEVQRMNEMLANAPKQRGG